MHFITAPDCICGGTASLPEPDRAPDDLLSMRPCGECVARYDRAHPAPAPVDPLAAMTAERDALRAAIAAHRSAMRTNTAAVMTANAATKARHPSSIGLITAAQRTIDLMHDTREALFALVPE